MHLGHQFRLYNLRCTLYLPNSGKMTTYSKTTKALFVCNIVLSLEEACGRVIERPKHRWPLLIT